VEPVSREITKLAESGAISAIIRQSKNTGTGGTPWVPGTLSEKECQAINSNKQALSSLLDGTII